MNKQKGIFYTPIELANFLIKHLERNIKKSELHILEPSCGDGVFVESFYEYCKRNLNQQISLYCIEIDNRALKIAVTKCGDLPNLYIKPKNIDFLQFQKHNKIKYNFIIGNPPYIKREWLSNEQLLNIKEIYKENNLPVKNIRNIWVAFVLSANKMLDENGIFAFVLPNELLQVNFTKNIRQHLLDNYDRVEIIQFNSFLFNNIEQDTIILVCFKKHKKCGLFFSNNNDVGNIKNMAPSFKKKQLIENEKWTGSLLNNYEISFLNKIQKTLPKVSDYCNTSPGVVTAANNYFIIDEETVVKFNLNKYVVPIILKGSFVNGSVFFTSKDFEYLRKNNYPCFFIQIKENQIDDFLKNHSEYINIGLKQEINLRYKCKQRPVWFRIPGNWNSKAIFFKRTHKYPKLIKNTTDAIVTDAGYRILMLDDCLISLNSFIYSFYNSITLVFSELFGRFYGGGVLELTPNEFRKLPLPILEIQDTQFSTFSQIFENKQSITEILLLNNENILFNKYGFSKKETQLLEKIRIKLQMRRLKQ